MSNNKSILIIPQHIPYPLCSGGNIAQFAILVELQNFIDITLVLTINSKYDYDIVSDLKSRLDKTTIIVIDLSENNAQIDKFSFKNIVKTVLKLILKILIRHKTKINDTTNNIPVDEFDIPRSIQPIFLKSKKFIESLAKIINENNFDIIQVEFFEYLDLIEIIPSGVKTIFVHHEIRYERLLKSLAVNNENSSFKTYIIDNVKRTELALLAKYNCILTFSENDKELLKASLNNRIEVIPFPVLSEEFDYSARESKIDKLIFIGSDGHYPNKDAVDWFISEIFDEVWNQYKLPFYIIGNWDKALIAKYKNDKKIIFTGYVEDLSPYYENSISVVPVRIGSGIRAKILYAMAHRSPVLTSINGAEGIDIKDGIHFLQAENKNDYLIAIKKLLEDQTLVKTITKNAFNFVEMNYYPTKITNKRLELYEILFKDSE